MALEWLDAIEARANAATPGPWEAFEMDETDEGTLRRGPWWIQQESTGRILFDGAATKEADAEFVAHAREDVPRLCRAVREYAAANVSLTEAVDHLVDAVSALWECDRLDGLLDEEDDPCVRRLGEALDKARLAVREARAAVERVERGDG